MTPTFPTDKVSGHPGATHTLAEFAPDLPQHRVPGGPKWAQKDTSGPDVSFWIEFGSPTATG